MRETIRHLASHEHASEEETMRILLDAITAKGKYRIIERFERRERYHIDDGTSRRTALYVDVETTGLDTASDAIIQLAILPFEFSSDGRIYDVHECEIWFEDPGVPIPAVITELTGIAEEHVLGHRIDDDRVRELLDKACLVIAHNATFDRQVVERRLPSFATKYWACSREDIPWQQEGLRSSSLEWLAYKQCGMYYEMHRADSDCYMAVHLLTTKLPRCERTAFACLLESARRKMVRIWALGSAKATRFSLKARGYRWNDGANGNPLAWWKDIYEDDLNTELTWLANHVYTGGLGKPSIQKFDGRLRYSNRVALLQFIPTQAALVVSPPC